MATAGFSFEQDIAPLRGANFGGVTSYALAKERALERDTALRIAEIQERARSRDIAFQQQQLLLERQTEEARRQREALERTPDVTVGLTSILDDPEKDDATKAAEVARFKMENAGLVSVSPTISNLFTTAEKSIESRQKDKERVNGLAYALMQTGEVDAVKGILEGSDNPLADEYISAAEAIAARRKAEGESKFAAEEAKYARERAEKEREEQRGYLKGYMDTLRRLSPPTVKDEGDMEIGTLRDGAKTPAIPKARPFAFATEDRIELEVMMRDLNPMLENKDLSDYTDEDLYRAALTSTTSMMRKSRGSSSSGFPSSRFSSKSTPE